MENPAQPEEQLPRLYTELADWWHLISSPVDYDEEAEFISQTLQAACQPKTLLELGCGGGNNASHLKKHFQLTLVDLSAGMLAASKRLNPECEHILADMRTLQLRRQFDSVLIHDAIGYMTTTTDLEAAVRTAAHHCRAGGAVIIMPDFIREMFAPKTEHGGEDGSERSARYLSWTYDPDPTDSEYIMDFAYLLRQADGSIECVHDRHVFGIFSKDTWLETLQRSGLSPQVLEDNSGRVIFLGMK